MSQTTVTDGGASSQAQEKVQDAAGQAREKAQEGAERAKQGVRGQVDQRSTEAGRRVRTQSEDIRSVADQLREQGKEGPAKLAEQAADRTQRLGSYLEESDADRILGDVEDYARRNPWAVALGGLALGFAASRMLRASSTGRYESGWERQRSGQRPDGAALPATTGTGQIGQPPRTTGGYEPPVASTPPVGEL